MRHIRRRHPDVVQRHFADLATTLAHPQIVCRSRWTASTWLFVRWLPHADAYLVVAVVRPPPFASAPWIVTAYTTREFEPPNHDPRPDSSALGAGPRPARRG